MRSPLRATIALALFLPCTAWAQVPPDDTPHGQVAVGAGVAPRYDGSDERRVIPFLLGDVRYRGVTLELRGLRARVDLASDPRLSIGPVLGARLNRDDVDGPVGLLPTIGTAVEAGGYVGYRFGGDALGQGALSTELTVVHDVAGVHDGLSATASLGYAAVRTRDTFVALDVQASWADRDYTRTYFGIGPADAARSGLAAYRPGGGFRDIGAGLTAGHYLDRHWGVIGRLGATYLVGDAADSPVTEQGSRWQPLAGLTLSYRF
ncbi:MipA/OmpV family protein [Sphingomonas sp. BK235]|jgi:MipA family protein|uniref:MipA/OmpV family protein n=1 Tax=Sphingomonas sp. BK235 TaxID=2512131 RepID=UPI00104D5F5E|nr:MipA/OmpV family protein [Sphingomonas sp. BK235]TCP33568.1 outer membrane scaffolding protein for murein synthesis (MipA/OmpV family) [Sphingomonas sp. BK235]